MWERGDVRKIPPSAGESADVRDDIVSSGVVSKKRVPPLAVADAPAAVGMTRW